MTNLNFKNTKVENKELQKQIEEYKLGAAPFYPLKKHVGLVENNDNLKKEPEVYQYKTEDGIFTREEVLERGNEGYDENEFASNQNNLIYFNDYEEVFDYLVDVRKKGEHSFWIIEFIELVKKGIDDKNIQNGFAIDFCNYRGGSSKNIIIEEGWYYVEELEELMEEEPEVFQVENDR